MEYVLVVQFPKIVLTYDKAIELEDMFINKLQGVAEVDGHDIGLNEINIFILTNDVTTVFENTMLLLDDKLKSTVKVAYRNVAAEDYVVLYPNDLISFHVS
jgi:hypothetical protein